MSASGRRVLVTQRFFDDATRDYLEANGCEVVVADLPPGKGDGDYAQADLEALLAGTAGWIVGHARVTRDLMAALPDLKVVSRRGVGYERVDLDAARDLGKVVAIAAGGNDASVADHTIGLILAIGRRFRESQANMQAGNWSILMGSDLYRKTVGVVGAGRIGRSVVQRLRGFEAEVLVHSNSRDETWAAANGVTYVDMPTLLARSDVVTLHAPLTPATKFLINADALAAMKPGAILINTARGGLVDDRAMLESLQRRHLGGAGLDTFMSESDPDWRPVTDALLALPNVVATPHAAASSREGLDRTNMVAARSVVAVLDGGDPARECVVADGRRP